MSVNPVQRVSHIALVIEDPVPTHKFWTEIMGLRYSTCFLSDYNHGTGAFEPYLHTFYTLPDGTSIAYFIMLPGAPQPTPDWQSHPARHFSLIVERAEDLPRWAAHLRQHGIEVQQDFGRDSSPALYFRDPNGIRFELTVANQAFNEQDEQAAAQILQSWLTETRQRQISSDK